MNVPLSRPHPTASGLVGSAPLVLVDLETDQGLTGQSYVFCYTPIALKPIADLIEALQPLIQGDAVAPLALAQKLQGRFRLIGPEGFTGIAMAGIDMAAWDVLAKSAAYRSLDFLVEKKNRSRPTIAWVWLAQKVRHEKQPNQWNSVSGA